jgi:hypothetical protein
MKGERQEDGGDHRQLLHDAVEAVRDRGEVDVHRSSEQVAVAIDQVADPDQVVVHIAEGTFVLVLEFRVARRCGPSDSRMCRAGVSPPCAFRPAAASFRRSKQEEARELFERLLDLRRDVGLLSEDHGPGRG